MSVVAELQRRRVFRALIAYGLVSFALLQVVEPVMHGLHLPETTLTFAIVGLGFGFPLVVALAWAFDLKAGRLERTVPVSEHGLRGARLALLLIAIGVVAAAPGVVWYFFIRGPAKQTAAAAAPSIAVLPFVNMSADSANEYLSDGITEELIDALTHFEDLRVASRTSAFAFKGKPADVSEIGTRLKVATVLEGSVRREGSRVRLTAQLVDVANGYHLWSQTYEREMKDVFAVEGELARSIAATLRPRLFPASPRDKTPTQDPEAHDLYLRGRLFWNRRTERDLTKAVALFEQASQHDPRYALAYVGVADSYLLLIDYGTAPKAEMLPKARAAALRALEIDSDFAEPHATLGLIRIHERDWRGAEGEFRRAIELNPGYPTAHHWYADVLAALGRPEAALSEAKLALRLDPTSMAINSEVASVYYFLREYDRAIEQGRRAVELNPDSPGPHILLALAHLKKGATAESLAEVKILERLLPGRFPGIRAFVYVANGNRSEALRLREYEGRYQTFVRGMIDAALGDLDSAFGGFETAIAADDYPNINWKLDPIHDPLRSDPRFGRLLTKLNLE